MKKHDEKLENWSQCNVGAQDMFSARYVALWPGQMIDAASGAL